MANQFFESPDDEEAHHAYHSFLEKRMQGILTPFEKFAQSQITASAFLLLCTIIALVWSSIPSLTASYQKFVHIPIGIYISEFSLDQTLRFWINDLLLTLFFFFVGLEIKREFLVGELRNHKRSVLVIIAAIGGMAMPALIYLLFNAHTPNAKGWAIPIATDTAFTLGILACFRKKLPKGAFTFMAALAIIDDIGAIFVIALFYTKNVNVTLLFVASAAVILLALINYAGFRKPTPYLIIGLFIWGLTEAAGIHGTIAGIAVAFTIPARPKRGPKQFLKRTKRLLERFEERKLKNPFILRDTKQHIVLEELKDITEQATTPLQRWESALQLPVSLLVLPIFALVNAGTPLSLTLLNQSLIEPVPLGILLGLAIGKPLGITLFSRIALWCRVGELPNNTGFRYVISIAFLAGIGFTMSFFMGNLAFYNQLETFHLTKVAILLGSLISGITGAITLILMPKKPIKKRIVIEKPTQEESSDKDSHHF